MARKMLKTVVLMKYWGRPKKIVCFRSAAGCFFFKFQTDRRMQTFFSVDIFSVDMLKQKEFFISQAVFFIVSSTKTDVIYFVDILYFYSCTYGHLSENLFYKNTPAICNNTKQFHELIFLIRL